MFPLALFGFGVTIPAVDRLIAARLERNFGLLAALGTGGRVHLARASIAVTAASAISETLGPAVGTAGSAALGLISIALGRKELLLFSRKGKGFSAIGTGKGFLSVSH